MSFFRKSPIRFDGTKEIETKVKNQTDNVISRRFKILMDWCWSNWSLVVSEIIYDSN